MSLEETIANNRPNYCHALEVGSVVELQNTLENCFEYFVNEGFVEDEVFQFLRTITVYYRTEGEENEQDEEEVNDFDVVDFLLTLLSW